MTTTQVQYWNYKEQVRHDKATENLTAKQINESVRHAKVTEKTENTRVKEIIRHDMATESIDRFKAEETKRHNLASEALTATQIDEMIRHNKATENLTQKQIDEALRHNLATEAQTDIKLKNEATSIKNQATQIDAVALWNRVHSVTEFANAMEKAGMPIANRIYLIEELLVNPDISRESKEQLMQLVGKMYDSLDPDKAARLRSATPGGGTGNKTKGNPYKPGTAKYNQWQKYAHK